jgi:hypothetical protein
VVGDQRMQRRHPLDALGQPPLGQPPPVLVEDLDVVMGLGPVISDEQHPLLLLRPASAGPNPEEKTVAT